MTRVAASPLLAGLVDDAGLFPPTSLAMDAAVQRHRDDQVGGSPLLTHRLLCPVSRVAELLDALRADDAIVVGLIADTGAGGVGDGVAAVTADPRLALASVDLAVAADADVEPSLAVLGALPDGVTGWVEPRRGDGWLEVLPRIAGAGLGAKLRCGGASPDAFPAVDDVAAFVRRCVELELPFKATAGLHRAVRGLDPDDGIVHHGYLNLLVATARAASGAALADVLAAVASTDPVALVSEARSLSGADVAGTRRLLVCYGSCSTAEPSDEATALGLLR